MKMLRNTCSNTCMFKTQLIHIYLQNITQIHACVKRTEKHLYACRNSNTKTPVCTCYLFRAPHVAMHTDTSHICYFTITKLLTRRNVPYCFTIFLGVYT